jgi:death on curing protein
MKINILTKDIIDIHDKIIKRFGGEKGVISTSSIDFVLSHFKMDNFNEDFFTILSKIIRAIVIDHPFIDGNKRTGLVICESILQDNSFLLNITEFEKENFILEVAKLKKNLTEIRKFLKNNCEKF